MSCSCASSSRWTNVNEELEHLVVNMPKLTIEEHGEWKELAKMMQDVMAPPEALFHTANARDQVIFFGEVGKVYAVKWKDVLDNGNYHNVVYNQDLDQPVIVVGWTALRDFYQLTGDHLVSLHHYDLLSVYIIPKMILFISPNVYLTEQKVSYSSLDVSSIMYYFLKDKGCTHLYLEDVAECRLVFNHWRKTLKIEVRWKHLCETLSLTRDMEMVFEFINPDVNRVLYWPCL
ncbi:hypothetical protein GmHk_02G005981 [Glycine max]|nr:hypothetical protein GmHk_02G005981 [Glycine max]